MDATVKCRRLRIFVTGMAVGVACLWTFVAMGGCHHLPDQAAFTKLSASPEASLVQLRCAKIPYVAPVAAHCWFAEFDARAGRWHRWEVWQTAGQGDNHWGHVRKDLMSAGSGVGAGESWALAEWRGAEAERLRAVLNEPAKYPYREVYHYVPGPNSNTYVAWVLRTAAVECDLPPAAIGKGYR